jgi:glycosyltransferase involved in cell wall biosynthesis
MTVGPGSPFPRRILLVTDAWRPQTNGVVRALEATARNLEAMGHEVEVVGPDRFGTLPLPTYPEIRLAVTPGRRLPRMIHAFAPDAIHVATEGPLGWAARRWCLARGIPFTTSFHTMFPEYVKLRFRVPESWTFAVLRRFHGRSAGVMVSTATMERTLAARGFRRLVLWRRGVDVELFRPIEPVALDLPRPVQLYVGRVAVEKNIEAFLKLRTEGTKVVVGDGPMLPALRSKYPDAVFLGARYGEDLVRHYCAADVFVFPSLTDTLGLVQLEALACGVPVAAFPVRGPIDIIRDPAVGCLDRDLGTAIRQALRCDRERCRSYALEWSWAASAREFVSNLHPIARQAAAPTKSPAGAGAGWG